MPVYAFQVNKRHPWHGGFEDIGNLYHYLWDSEDPSDDQLEFAAATIVGDERIVMPDTVEYQNVVVYGPTDGSDFENVIRLTYGTDQAGAIAAPQGASQTTTAVFVGWPLPRSPETNRRRRLGKYLRPAYGACNDDGALSGRTRIPQDIQDFIRTNYALEVEAVGDGSGTDRPLCTNDGVTPARNPYISNYITNRQITR